MKELRLSFLTAAFAALLLPLAFWIIQTPPPPKTRVVCESWSIRGTQVSRVYSNPRLGVHTHNWLYAAPPKYHEPFAAWHFSNGTEVYSKKCEKWVEEPFDGPEEDKNP